MVVRMELNAFDALARMTPPRHIVSYRIAIRLVIVCVTIRIKVASSNELMRNTDVIACGSSA